MIIIWPLGNSPYDRAILCFHFVGVAIHEGDSKLKRPSHYGSSRALLWLLNGRVSDIDPVIFHDSSANSASHAHKKMAIFGEVIACFYETTLYEEHSISTCLG